jgi:hypothetical protein
VPICVLEHLEATAIHVVLVNTPAKVVAAYLYPIRPFTEWGATNCLGEGCPLLMARDLKVKHRDFNSILKVAMVSLLCDYAYRNSCFVYDPDSPTNKPHNIKATPGVLYVLVVMVFVLPAHLTICHAVRSANPQNFSNFLSRSSGLCHILG